MNPEITSAVIGAGVAVFLAIAEYNRRMLGALHRRFDDFEHELEDIKIALATKGIIRSRSQGAE